ncbi:hypothetical protein Tco_1064549 [Tanacetum coccineum]
MAADEKNSASANLVTQSVSDSFAGEINTVMLFQVVHEGLRLDDDEVLMGVKYVREDDQGYFDSEGRHQFLLENLLNGGDPLHHEFADELITLPSRTVREHEDYLNRMTLLCEISTSRSQENVHANQSSIIESLPVSPIPVEDSDPVQEEIDIFLVPDDLIPPGVENDDSEDEDNELPNLDHQDIPFHSSVLTDHRMFA